MNQAFPHFRIVAGIAALALLLGFCGHVAYYESMGVSYGLGDALYGAIQLFPLNSGGIEPGKAPWHLHVARFLAPVAAVYAVLAALLLAGKTYLALRFIRKHAIICGFGHYGQALARYYYEKKHMRVVVIDSAPDDSGEALARSMGVYWIYGDALDAAVLKKAHLEQAEALAVTCGNDAVNLMVAAAAAKYLQSNGRTTPLRCDVQTKTLPGDSMNEMLEALHEKVKLLDVRAFDPDVAVAFNTLRKNPLDYKPLAQASSTRVQFVLVEWTPCAKALALTTARMAHYANGLLPRVVVFNWPPEAEKAFHARYPQAKTAAEFIFAPHTLESPEGTALLLEVARLPDAITTIAFCGEDPALVLGQAFNLSLELQGEEPRKLVRISNAEVKDFADALRTGKTSKYLQIFGEYGDDLGMVLDIDTAAQMLHERYLNTVGQKSEDAPLRPAERPWSELPLFYKQSNRLQALHLHVKARAVNCELAPDDGSISNVALSDEEVEMLAAMEHRRWMAEKSLAGWRRGEERDDGRRLSPLLIPYNELPENEKDKDREPVRAMAEVAGKTGKVLRRKTGHA